MCIRDRLDTVVVIRIVAGRNHDAAVKVIYTSDVRHRRGCGDVEQIGICTRSRQACNQTILEHIGAAAGILTDDDAGRLGISIALTESIVIPAKKSTNLIGVVCR